MRRITTGIGLCLAVLFGLVVTLHMAAKDKDTTKMMNVQGRVHMVDKDSSTITVDTKDGRRRLVVYGPDTKFKYGHSTKGKDSSWDQVKENNYISCAGSYDEKTRLVAKECVHRDSK